MKYNLYIIEIIVTMTNVLYGSLGIVGASICIAGTKIILNTYKSILVFSVTTFLLSTFLPALCLIFYFNAKSQHPYDISSIFTNPIKLIVGFTNFFTISLSLIGYLLVPISFGTPLFYSYPLFYSSFAYFINDTPITYDIFVGFAVILLSLGIMLGFNDWSTFNVNKRIGVVFLILSAIAFGFYFTFISNAPHRSFLQRATEDIQTADKSRSKWNILSIQLFEASALPTLIMVVITAALLMSPNSWLNTLTQYIPKVFVSKSYGKTIYTIPIMFLLFLIVGTGRELFFDVGTLELPTNLNSALMYFNVIVSAIAGYLFLNEHVSWSQLVGIIGISCGASYIVYAYENKHKNAISTSVNNHIPNVDTDKHVNTNIH